MMAVENLRLFRHPLLHSGARVLKRARAFA
jgi:hypothetical protein